MKDLHGPASAQIYTIPWYHSVLLQMPGMYWELFYVSQISQALTCLAAFIFTVLSAWAVLFLALSLTVSLSLRHQDEGTNVTSSEYFLDYPV